MDKSPTFEELETIPDLTGVGVPQLIQLKSQVEHEIELFQESLTNLKMVQGKFQESLEAVEKLSSKDGGRNMLVPLTGSIYVSGKCIEPDNLMIDVGTGYYLKMTQAQAKDYFQRRIIYVTKKMEKIQKVGNEKLRSREVITEFLHINLANLTMVDSPSSS